MLMKGTIRELIGSPSKVLGGAFCVGLVMLVLVMIFPMIYRDSVNYMAAVNAFELHNWRTAFNLTFVPLLFMMGALFRPLGLNACQCLTLVSSGLALGMLFLGYRVLSFYMDRKLAAWGSALFFIMHPVFRASFAPLTDSSRWFSILLCWWLILLYLKRPSWQKLLWLGVSYAAFSLFRSEGIVFVGLFSIWFFVELCRAGKFSFAHLCRSALLAAAPLLVMGVLLFPRLVQMHHETGFYALDTRQAWAIRGVVSHVFPEKAQKMTDDPLVAYFSKIPFHYSYLKDGELTSRYISSLVSGNYRAYALFSLIGLIQIVRRRRWERHHTLVCVFAVVNAITYLMMRSFAARYFYINTFLFMPFTMVGFVCVGEFIDRLQGKGGDMLRAAMPWLLAAAVIIGVLGAMKDVFSQKDRHYRGIGKYMRSVTAEGKTRSGTPHPVYLIVGKNYGWGFHCNGNELVYSYQFEMNSRFTLAEILSSGVPPVFCSFAVDPMQGVTVLKPDYLLVSDEAKPEELLKSCSSLVEEMPQRFSSKVSIYRVKSE